MRSRESRRSLWKPVLAALGFVIVCGLAASAASYARTTLKELTGRSKAVVEVQVLDHHYPPMKPGDNFPRTHVDVKVLKTLKGNIGDSFQLDLPGGMIDGETVGHVPDAPDFRNNERAIVFVKEQDPGHFMVQDLGLGKFTVVEREGKTFVENATCPGSIAPGQRLQDQKDVESMLITKSIPYATFCSLVEAYAAGREPDQDPSALSARLPGASVHSQNPIPTVVADAHAMAEAKQLQRGWLIMGIIFGTTALLAGLLVARRRKAATVRNVSMLVIGAMAAGAFFGGAGTYAFVQFDNKTIWDLNTASGNKVANNTIVWSQTPSVSKTNANVFTNVAGSFGKWATVQGSRLNFTQRTSSNTTAVNSTSDGENIIAWTSTPSGDFSASTLAITFSSFSVTPTSNFKDGDIIFNDRDFNWSTVGNASSVALHEIGHFIGLQHTMSMQTVMFPFDGGLTNLSADEIAAAIALYPGANANGGTTTMPPAPGQNTPPPPTNTAATPPVAAAQGSPTSGGPGLVVSFTSAGSAPGTSGAAIDSFEWDFGDGSLGVGPTVSHTYDTVGTYSATLMVTDVNGNISTASVTIQVGATATAVRGSFKLNFKKDAMDSFSCVISSPSLIGIRAPKGAGQSLHGSVNIGDQPWQFDFDTAKLKTTNTTGPKITVNDRNGTLTLTIKSTALQDALGGLGADNDDVSGVPVDVPVQIWFGGSSTMYPFAVIPFTYSAKADKSGAGKH